MNQHWWKERREAVAALFVGLVAGVVVTALPALAAPAAVQVSDGQFNLACSVTGSQVSCTGTLPTAAPTPTPTATPTATPTPTPTATASPTPSPTPTATVPPGSLAFPMAFNTGVPPGWVPTTTRTTDLVVSTAGTVVENVRLINASIILRAPNITIRNVEIQGGEINTSGINSACSGHLIQNVSIIKGPGQVTTYAAGPVIGPGGYTAIGVKIDGLPEGMRVGEKDHCGPVVVRDSYINVVKPDNCNGDWHGDGLQGYLGAGLTVRHSTFRMLGVSTSCDGTSPFFWPNQGNGTLDADGVLAIGGLYYAFRAGTPGTVNHLYLAPGDFDVKCPALSFWDAHDATVNALGVVTPGAVRPCNTNGGN